MDTALKPTSHMKTYTPVHVYKQHLLENVMCGLHPDTACSHHRKRLETSSRPLSSILHLCRQTNAQAQCLKVGSCYTNCLHENHHKNHL